GHLPVPGGVAPCPRASCQAARARGVLGHALGPGIILLKRGHLVVVEGQLHVLLLRRRRARWAGWARRALGVGGSHAWNHSPRLVADSATFRILECRRPLTGRTPALAHPSITLFNTLTMQKEPL